jgi:hypothetical protein
VRDRIMQVKIARHNTSMFGWMVWSRTDDLSRWWPQAATFTKWGARLIARRLLAEDTGSEILTAPSHREDGQ